MASGGTVEIQVQLEGAGNVQKRLNQLGQGATVAGEKFTAAGTALATSSNIMTSSLGGVVGSVGVLSSGIGTLTTATQTAGAGFLSFAGPIIAVGAAIAGVVLAIKRYIKQSSDLTTMLEAQKAAYTDFTSLLERLTDQNITLTEEETRRFKSLIRLGKAELEYVQRIEEGEGVAGQRLRRYREEEALARQNVRTLKERFVTEAAFLEQSREARFKLRLATERLNREERDLDRRRMEALGPLREVANEEEQLMKTRGRAALEAQAAAARKAEEQAAQALQNMRNLQSNFESESLRVSASSLSDRLYLLRVELAERARAIEASAVDEQQKAETLFAAEQSFAAKRRALIRAASQQRQAQRAQEAAAAVAAERSQLQELQRLAEAQVRLNSEGFEQQRQLIELRYQFAENLAQNEIQTQTLLLNKHRELADVLQQEQEAMRQADLQRIESLQQSFALMQQDLELLDIYDRAKQLDIELTREQAQALRDLNATDLDIITNAVSSFSQGLLYSSFAALQSGTSLKAAAGEALKAIALQAGVESIMETARGIAALATGLPTDAVLASKHFQAAAFFAAAASVSGVVGAKLAPNGGGGGGGGGASPTGTAQSVRDIDRGDREERGAVTINVNMGQATIYDTKAAAERAFADRVVSAINSPRRGAVRHRRS